MLKLKRTIIVDQFQHNKVVEAILILGGHISVTNIVEMYNYLNRPRLASYASVGTIFDQANSLFPRAQPQLQKRYQFWWPPYWIMQIKQIVRPSQICTPSSDQGNPLIEAHAKFGGSTMGIAKVIGICKRLV